MLSRAKITFETPNVMDPGCDQPPSRPARGKRQEKYFDNPGACVAIRERPNYTDSEDFREQFKPPLTQTIKLNYADDEPDHLQSDDVWDDVEVASPEESGSRVQQLDLQSLSARNPSVLARTEHRDRSPYHSTQSAPLRWPRRGRRSTIPSSSDESSTEGLFKDQPLSSGVENPRNVAASVLARLEHLDQPQVRRRRHCLRALVALLVVVLVVCFSILAHQAGKSARKSTADPLELSRLSLAMEFLAEHGISQRELLEDPLSAQYQAIHWIAVKDFEQRGIPADLVDNPYEFIQRYVLAVLYFAWNGPQWLNSLNFMSDVHECSWFRTVPDESDEPIAVGVTCDNHLQVRNLVMPSNNLGGSIPEEISQLTKVEFLNLKQNALTGTIPSYLKQLSLLDYLDLSHNQISGTIPDFLGDLDGLEVLGLGHNELTGTVPKSLGNLQLLKTFAVDDNFLTGDLFPVSQMTNLRYLYAENNVFQGKLDSGILADLARLVELDLSGNRFEADSLPRYLFTHPRLRVLDLHDNQLAGTIPDTIPANTALTYLSLRENDISSSIPKRLQNLSALTHLDLESNALTGTLPAEELGKMTTLTYLFLGKNPITSATIPDKLRSLKSLRELSLDNLRLTGPIPSWIENFSDLKLLDLRTNSLTGTISVDFSNLQQLTYLMLSGNLLTGPVPETLGAASNLVVVSMHQNGFIGETGDLCSAYSAIQLLTTDCGTVKCPCCNDCYNGEDIYGEVLWDTLENSQGDWEQNFERSDYGFNPHILFANEKPKR